ncbi:hypothetical protein OCC_02084 [Thermococcus litoralis DSM 5473]|uniref:Phosphoribosyltransferase domain-containing protein n=1 Tax=Thermococcus litoralis (strain ATCC 51850 / DSM 5473 / JCM 8560 / NS-C) TaxID=523849 RepID=H3ZJQ5_THELN|nr:uracil phosphoribosyltransferase [Thermococcus litoralis]EHR79818.1 hypothetical protein OCC_02084 [Thermococcus litoralis DSM 5473]
MSQVIILNDLDLLIFKNKIRDRTLNGEPLQKLLRVLGVLAGAKILSQLFAEDITLITPLSATYTGKTYRSDLTAVIITNKDDYEALGEGLSEVFPISYRGYLDLERIYGKSGFTSKVRGAILPDVPTEVDILIIAKSVLASGCSLIALTKNALAKYNPRITVIIAIFYSKEGLNELIRELPNTYLFVIGDADKLREDGMLVPGVGMIDERLKT